MYPAGGAPPVNHLQMRNRRGAHCAPALWLNGCLAVPCTGSGRAAGEQCSPLRLRICRWVTRRRLHHSVNSPFSIFNYQFLQKVKEKHRRSSAVRWHDWCVSRVLSWTVIYLECTLPCISSRQSGRSGKPWSRSALLRIEFTGPPCYHGAR